MLDNKSALPVVRHVNVIKGLKIRDLLSCYIDLQKLALAVFVLIIV